MTTSSRGHSERAAAVRTFLIADIRGYTRFTAQRGDEAASRLAARFAEITAEGVEAWGGSLLELRGDEALCVFDSARAALRASVELQDVFGHETEADPSLPLGVGIGLDAGEAAPVGDGYRGAALNLAARLSSAAGPGEIYASQGLVHLAGRADGIEYTTLSPTAIKGLDEPVTAVRVGSGQAEEAPAARVIPHTGESQPPLPPELDSLVPLAGREADLRWLSWHWRMARHGHGRHVVLAGPAGIGKTRLAGELAMDAHAAGTTIVYFSGAATPATQLLGAANETDVPTLVILDDLDAAPAAFSKALADLVDDLSTRPILLLVAHGDLAQASMTGLLDRLTLPHRQRSLKPLGAEAVRAIAAMYVERSIDALPLELILGESGGVPVAVHRVASQWARSDATRRLSAAAERTASDRRGLRTAEGELIEGMADLELARERASLYQTDPTDAGDRLVVCPYKGLATFEASDAEYFFGRDRLTGELVARLVGTSFVGLVGASGSGKSSVLRAGLLPALARGVVPGSDRWLQVVMRPGEHPLTELEASLARALSDRDLPAEDPRAGLDVVLGRLAPGQRLVLVVDQLEELFSATRDKDERDAFVELLTAERTGLKVIVALRADHYVQAATFPSLARLLSTSQVLVAPLSRAELAAIIERPAQRVGLRVEDDLVEALVTDCGDEPGALPLLSTALLELWQTRSEGRLTLAAYRATGGLHGAVGRLAEDAYGDLDPAQREIARSLLLRLAGEGEGDAVIRRRVPLGELDTERDAAMAEVLEALTEARLLTIGDGYVEVAHEALLREWPRLRDWLDDDASGRRVRLHLAHAARDWEERGREPGDLYRGARLAAALDWAQEHAVELNATERAFLEDSHAAAERETERQRRTNRRLRGLLAGAAILLMVAVGAGLFANQQAHLAHARELAASAIAVLDQDPELSILLALEALELGGDALPEAVSALHRAVQTSRSIMHLASPGAPESAVRPLNAGVALSPDGRTLYVSHDSRSVKVYDVGSGELVRTLGTPGQDSFAHALGIGLSSDGSQLAYVDEDGVIHVWDLVSDTERRIRSNGFGTTRKPAFSPDGRRLATVTFDSRLRDPDDISVAVWDLDTGELLREWKLEAFAEVHFHPDGEQILVPDCSCARDGMVRLFAVGTGEETELIQGAFLATVLSPDGKWLATAGTGRRANLYNVEDGSLVHSLVGHKDIVTGVAFSPDGSRLATTSFDGTLRIWDVETAEPLITLAGQGGVTNDPSFSSDGTRLASGSSNLTSRVWDVSRTRPAEVEGRDLGFARIIAVDRHDDLVAFLGRDCAFGYCLGRAFVLDLSSGATMELPDRAGVGVKFSPDGQSLLSQVKHPDPDYSDALGPIQMQRLWSDTVVYELDGICPHPIEFTFELCGRPPEVPWEEQASRFAFSADGSVLAMLGNAGALSFWDGSTGSLTGVIPYAWLREGTWFGALEFSPDGSLLALGGADVVVYDAEPLRAFGSMFRGDPENRFALRLDDRLLLLSREAAAAAGMAHLEELAAEWLAELPSRSPSEINRWSLVRLAGASFRELAIRSNSSGRDWVLISSDGFARPIEAAGLSRANLAAPLADALNGWLSWLEQTETDEVDPDDLAEMVWHSLLIEMEGVPVGDAAAADLEAQAIAVVAPVVTLPGDPQEMWRVTFSSDGRLFAVATGTVTNVYEVADWSARDDLGPSWGLDFSADGQRAVTMNVGGTARLWDLSSTPARELDANPVVSEGLGVAEGAMLFANDERNFITVDAGKLLVMTFDIDELADIARSRLTRSFTAAECDKYQIEGCEPVTAAGARAP
jgi:WD40 repeat protein/class 3 adenylate cyclase